MPKPGSLATLSLFCALLAFVMLASSLSALVLLAGLGAGAGAALGGLLRVWKPDAENCPRPVLVLVGAFAGLLLNGMVIWIPVSGFLEAQVRAKTGRSRKALTTLISRITAQPEGQQPDFLLSLKPEDDPFTDGQPLRVRLERSGIINTWSIGPDRLDQNASLEYDPTNGTVSAGDVVVRSTR